VAVFLVTRQPESSRRNLVEVAVQHVNETPGFKPAYVHLTNSSFHFGFYPSNALFERLE